MMRHYALHFGVPTPRGRLVHEIIRKLAPAPRGLSKPFRVDTVPRDCLAALSQDYFRLGLEYADFVTWNIEDY